VLLKKKKLSLHVHNVFLKNPAVDMGKTVRILGVHSTISSVSSSTFTTSSSAVLSSSSYLSAEDSQDRDSLDPWDKILHEISSYHRQDPLVLLDYVFSSPISTSLVFNLSEPPAIYPL
jgi:hypothetical protein